MSLVTKHYFLPEDENTLKIDNQASDMYLGLWDISQALRQKVKYASDDMSEEEYNLWVKIQDDFYELMSHRNINLDIE